MISKSHGRDHLTDLLKQKKSIPGPTAYNTTLNLLMKKNMFIYKKDRTSFCDDIIKKAKETPGVGIYQPLFKDKVKGSFKRYK